MGRREWPTAERRLAPWLADAPLPGSAWQQHPPPVFPPRHACAYGDDIFGLWYEFAFKGARQRMRWIPPGSFSMGSPSTEAERDDDEKPHSVTLSYGYWLADTACTQAMWKAVTGENPSRFTGDDHPVENVSWNDIKTIFFAAIDVEMPELGLQLPSEAQWEYACRAGSETAFWWGNTLQSDQARYDYSRPYGKGRKAKEIRETKPVKSYMPNPWGLYQMHGNVWEWCEDCFAEYETGEVEDPTGPDSGTQRVLRGGSWTNDGGRLRSVCRDRRRPDSRGRVIIGYAGFRFSQVP